MQFQLDANQIISWVIQGGFGVIASIGLYLFKGVKSEIAKMRETTEKLNTQVAIVIERTTWHAKEIEKHERRLSSLEKTPRKRGQ